MSADLFSATILLILVLDPVRQPAARGVGARAVPRGAPRAHRRCASACSPTCILLAFMAGGRTFMQWLQLSDVSLSIAGGIILFLIALRMVFPHRTAFSATLRDGEPFLVPLAVPSIAGPSALATVMLMASRDPGAPVRRGCSR